jgi:pyruvate, water dikinase
LSARIEALLAAYHRQDKSLESAGAAIRKLFLKSEWPPQLAEAIREAYRQLARQIGTEAPIWRCAAAGIDSFSVNPDSFLAVKQAVARAERAARGG